MDIFRFRTDPATPTKLEHGEIINGLKSKLWIERYLEAGSFELVSNMSSGIRDLLPIGTFISHVDTDEVMVVETHSISEEKGSPTEIKVTGRSFETLLEQRVVGANRYFPNVGTVTDYTLAANYIWAQAMALINDHISEDLVIDPNDALPFVSVFGNGPAGEYLVRSVSKGDVYSKLLELLQYSNLGIRSVRPNADSPWFPDTALIIHPGVDRTNTVMFSNDGGEIESADYLWSNKFLKNSALVSGKWVEVRVDSLAATKYSRRMMYVEAKDIDEQFESAPTGTDLLNVEVKMEQRGAAALAAQKNIALTKTEVTKDGTKAHFRVDFNVGDLITVHGDYNETTTRRISEYVEIEDETGSKSYPTLTVDD